MDNGKVEKRRWPSPSLFGPIVLIALGIYFLLYNLGMAPALNWWAALQLWPLLLIFAGVNIIVRQIPAPWGALLSALVALAAVAIFALVLLSPAGFTPLSRFGLEVSAGSQREEISFPAGDVGAAEVAIDFSNWPAGISALEDSSDLIAGEIYYRGELDFEAETNNNTALVRLAVRQLPFFFFPWPDSAGTTDEQWQLGLNPRVPLRLNLDISSGAAELELSELTLQELNIDGSAGSVKLDLPDGEYDVLYESGSGSSSVTLPASGRQNLEIDGGSGSMSFYLPAGMQARVDVRGGSGSFSIDQSRFEQVDGNEPDEGIWQTEGYEGAGDRLDMLLDVGSGSVNIDAE